VTLAFLSRFKLFCLFHFSRPRANRLIYRKVYRRDIQRVLELGVGDCARAVRVINLIAAAREAKTLRYTGVDLFEARPDHIAPSLPLKEAYRTLKATGARIQLLPGDPFVALSRSANDLGQQALIVISADMAGEPLTRAWFYMPRLVHADTLVFQEDLETQQFRQVSRKQIQRLATASIVPQHRKAA
jgi:hypothetical protein